MRMAIQTRRGAVSGPSCMCNAGVRVKDLGKIWVLILNEFLEFGNLADLFKCKDFILLISVNS